YTYDAAGNIKTIIDANNSSQRQCFRYDELDRLTYAFTGNSNCTAYYSSGNGPYEQGYTLAGNGNMTRLKNVKPSWNDSWYSYNTSVSGCATGTPSSKPHAVSQAKNDTFSYDCNGNMTGRTIGGTSYSLTYNAENRLSGVSGTGSNATFTYDGDGNQVKTVVNGVTTYYPGRHYEWRNSSTYTKYYHAGGQLQAFDRTSGYGSYYGRRFVFRDHLGGTSVIVNGGGTPLWKDLYAPYGDLRYHWDSTPSYDQTQYRYTGQRFEPDLAGGLYDYLARFYDPTLGRFIQADTIVPEPGDPQNLNRYSYTRNNPIKYRDPSGHIAETVWDIANIAWDIHEVRKDPSLLNWGALVVDVAAAALPIVPGGAGLLVRGGKAVKAGVEVATHADEVVDAVRVVDGVNDVARAASRFQDLTHAASYEIKTFTELKKLTRGKGVEVHHIIEQRFSKTLGIKKGDILGVVLTHDEHVKFTNAWRSEIGYNNQKMDLLTDNAERDDIWEAAQRIYKDYPELLEASYEVLYP
ncbi:MAG: hypothetical protein GY753_13495, partial [Gammaproteobacteria bacterium]|nr:hypothetical protein [Gammaproteobacteria bacterium]